MSDDAKRASDSERQLGLIRDGIADLCREKQDEVNRLIAVYLADVDPDDLDDSKVQSVVEIARQAGVEWPPRDTHPGPRGGS